MSAIVSLWSKFYGAACKEVLKIEDEKAKLRAAASLRHAARHVQCAALEESRQVDEKKQVRE